MFPPEHLDAARDLLDACRAHGLKLVTAESCTGGLVAGLLTSVAGSSDVVERGFVTYSNEAKQQNLGVPAELIERVGAVSEEVARAMAEGGVAHSAADVGCGITGVAGPGGGTAEKPVGLVHIAAASRDGRVVHERNVFDGDRQAVRLKSVARAVELMAGLVAGS